MLNERLTQEIINILLENPEHLIIDVLYLKKRTYATKGDVLKSLNYLRFKGAVNCEEHKSSKNNKITNLSVKSIHKGKLEDLKILSKSEKVRNHLKINAAAYIIAAILIVAGILTTNFFEYRDFPPDDLRSTQYFSTEFIPLSGTSIHIGPETSTMPLIYFLVHEGNKCLVEGKLFYYLVNQTKNTCGHNLSFFENNRNLNILCKTEEYIENTEKILNQACHPYISYICEERKKFTTDFIDLVKIFQKKMENLNQSCEIQETIKLCMNNERHCSKNIDFNIFVTP